MPPQVSAQHANSRHSLCTTHVSRGNTIGVWVLWAQLVLGCSWCLGAVGTVGAVSVVTAQRSIKRFTDIKGVS